MNSYRILSFVFGIFSLGALKETYRILYSSAPDIASQRSFLSIMAFLFTGFLIVLTIYFWRKGKYFN